MARPLRIEFPGACYHVMNQGKNYNKIYQDDSDYKLFIEKLGELSQSYNVEMRSYCLMPSHFHLYLSTPNGNLSKFMQSLLTSYTISKNRRDRRSGHLFQGRFQSLLVEEDRYGSIVSRYIHLNPVKTNAMNNAEFCERVKLLREFKWSSYRSLVGLSICPQWFDRKSLLSRWGSRLKEQQSNYAEYVERGLIGDIKDPFRAAAARCILGSHSFINKYRQNLTEASNKPDLPTDQDQARKKGSRIDFDTLVQRIAEIYKVEEEDLLLPNQRGNKAREMLIYLSVKFCRCRYSLVEISNKLGISSGGLSSRRYKINQMLKRDKGFKRKTAQVVKYLRL